MYYTVYNKIIYNDHKSQNETMNYITKITQGMYGLWWKRGHKSF